MCWMVVEFSRVLNSVDFERIWVEKSVKIWARAPSDLIYFSEFGPLVRGFELIEKIPKIVKIVQHGRNVPYMWSKKHQKKLLLFTSQLQRYWGSKMHEIEKLNLWNWFKHAWSKTSAWLKMLEMRTEMDLEWFWAKRTLLLHIPQHFFAICSENFRHWPVWVPLR